MSGMPGPDRWIIALCLVLASLGCLVALVLVHLIVIASTGLWGLAGLYLFAAALFGATALVARRLR